MKANTMKSNKIKSSAIAYFIAICLTNIMLFGCDTDNNASELGQAVTFEKLREQGLFIESLTINDDHIRLTKGETHQLSAMALTNSGDVIDVTESIDWSSSDNSIATVNEQGLVTAVANSSNNQGIVIIMGTSINGIVDEGEISVSDVAVSAINLIHPQPEEGTIGTCVATNITANVNYEDGYISMNTIKDISFSLDSNTSATIDKNGTLYTSSPDIETSIITGTLDDITDSLTVIADPLNVGHLDILLDDIVTDDITLAIGERILVNGQATLTNTTLPSSIDNTIAWSQESGDYLGITTTGDNKGTLVGLIAGTTQLVGSCGGNQTTATVSVTGTAELDSIKINKGSDITLASSESVDLTLTAYYTDTPTSLNVSEFAHWSVSDTSLVTVELIDLGTNTASYQLTNISKSTDEVIVTVTYAGESSTINITLE